MRVIKFRAWDRTRKTMLPVLMLTPDVHPDVEQVVTVADFSKETTYLLHPGDYDLMQFTGILDKNGKEIFEDDIVRHYGKSVGGEYPKPGIVIYERSGFRARFSIGSTGMEWVSGIDSRFAVTGNIHEAMESKALEE